MDATLSRMMEKLERQKSAVLSGPSTWPVERLQFRTDAAAWSTLDVFDHLLKTEASLVRTAQSNLSKNRKVGIKEKIGGWMVSAMMRTPLRVKVPPTATAVLPGRAPDLSVIAPRWEKVRVEMADLVSRLTPEQLPAGLFRHPVSGWMTMPQALQFLSAHLRHHEYQLDRIRRASSGLS
jgi:hypothetical protein